MYSRSAHSSASSLLQRQPPSGHDSWGDRDAFTPAASSSDSHLTSISSKFSLSADPKHWGSNLDPSVAEPDDHIHNPEARGGKYAEHDSLSFSSRGIANIGCLAILLIGMLALFAGYPIVSYVTKMTSQKSAFAFSGTNASGQIPEMGNWGLIDLDTPNDAYTIKDLRDGNNWQLVFSDEFNTDGRTFWPGDDPYWEAVDLHYWGTNNMEWYSPEAVTTEGGALVITLSAKHNHDLDYMGGMMSTWNKFCFTGGYIVSAVTLPGITNVVGLWPALWTMGNLGRAGYGASLDGMWPYTYDSCDVGTLKNQTLNGLPIDATNTGNDDVDGALSYLPGQRLSRCTCEGESHPGPKHKDGTFVGRAAPEIDIFEAQVSEGAGEVSQSGQWAPFNSGYLWFNTSENLIINDPTTSRLNSYIGGSTQQATSVVTKTDGNCYQLGTGCFSVYGFQYKPGFDDAYITWVSDNKIMWTINQGGLAADTRVEIGPRPVPQEPMYILVNLGMSENFGDVDLAHLTFPAKMSIDYIRVYQDPSNINIGCDPPDFPTAAYIETYIEAYSNPNLTTWVDDYKQTIPKNSLIDTC